MTEANPLGFETVDLMPTEITAAKEIITYMHKKLGKCLTYEREDAKVRALAMWANEAENRFKEIGLVCIVDPYDTGEDLWGNPVLVPDFTVTGRLEDTAFDFDRAKNEVQHGLADGVVGALDANGLWHDPKKLM